MFSIPKFSVCFLWFPISFLRFSIGFLMISKFSYDFYTAATVQHFFATSEDEDRNTSTTKTNGLPDEEVQVQHAL